MFSNIGKENQHLCIHSEYQARTSHIHFMNEFLNLLKSLCDLYKKNKKSLCDYLGKNHLYMFFEKANHLESSMRILKCSKFSTYTCTKTNINPSLSSSESPSLSLQYYVPKSYTNSWV